MSSQCWMLDLDGVVWLADKPIPGASEAVARLRSAGHRVVFFTNNSFATRAELLEKFASQGIDCGDEDLFSSGQAAARLLGPGERAFVVGGPGIVEALTRRGVDVVDRKDVDDGASVDAVVVGLDLNLTFATLTSATRALGRGARLIATNDDATYPTGDGPLPGGGAILAAVAYASRKEAVVAGKPNQTAADLVGEEVGEVAVMVGDRPETDGLFAKRLRAKFALVRSGVTKVGDVVSDPTPYYDATDLSTLVNKVTEGSR